MGDADPAVAVDVADKISLVIALRRAEGTALPGRQAFILITPMGHAASCARIAGQGRRWARSSALAGYSCSRGSSWAAESSSPSLTSAWISLASGVTSLMDTIHSSA
jgi:hypothetical protein